MRVWFWQTEISRITFEVVKKRQPGRPPRVKQGSAMRITTRYSPDEFRLIKRAAAAANKRTSPWVRDLVLDGAKRQLEDAPSAASARTSDDRHG